MLLLRDAMQSVVWHVTHPSVRVFVCIKIL